MYLMDCPAQRFNYFHAIKMHRLISLIGTQYERIHAKGTRARAQNYFLCLACKFNALG